MENIQEEVDTLRHPDNKTAYAALKELTTESESGSGVYPFMDRFIEMMDDELSYIRTRGLILITANARWDTENKVDESLWNKGFEHWAARLPFLLFHIFSRYLPVWRNWQTPGT